MTCRGVQSMCDAYIDGELDAARVRAVRGHARDCEACRTLLADTAALREAFADLEPTEPPPGLWPAIGRALADAERADARRSPISLWWDRMRPRVLPGSVAIAGVCAALLWWTDPFGHQGAPALISSRADDGESLGLDAGARATEVSAVVPTLEQRHADSLADADAVHAELVGELEALYEVERERLAPALRTEIDRALASLERGEPTMASLGGAVARNPAFAGEDHRRTLRQRAAILQAALIERPVGAAMAGQERR